MDLNPYESPQADDSRSKPPSFWASGALLIIALAYPVFSMGCMFSTTGVSRIPMMEHWVTFVFVLPAIAAGLVLWAKVAGIRLKWVTVAAFAAWMAVVGWFQHWFIAAVWATI